MWLAVSQNGRITKIERQKKKNKTWNKVVCKLQVPSKSLCECIINKNTTLFLCSVCICNSFVYMKEKNNAYNKINIWYHFY